MNFTQEQKHQLNRLMDHRDEITNSLFHIERILKHYFPEEFDVAYQHWIPQISTALCDDKKWLPRGQQTMQHSLNRLFDKLKEEQDQKGVSKYIV
jgi:hypothetical protein